MKTASPVLLPLLRSEAQGEIIARLMLNPDVERSMSEIAREAGVSVATATREVDKLVAAALVTERRVGTARLVQANQANPAFKPLSELMAVTYGPVVIISRLLSEVPGVERAFVYGSYAARRAGEAGDSPHDIDVLVVGAPARADLFDVSAEASRRVHREVNIRRMSSDTWADDADPFVRTVKARPLIELGVGRDD
jgi:predicted nucleotidyltransferase